MKGKEKKKPKETKGMKKFWQEEAKEPEHKDIKKMLLKKGGKK